MIVNHEIRKESFFLSSSDNTMNHELFSISPPLPLPSLLPQKNKEKKETVTMITNESYDAKRMNFANSSSRRKTEPPLLYHRLHRRAKNINLFKKKGEEYEKSKEEITILVVQRVWL